MQRRVCLCRAGGKCGSRPTHILSGVRLKVIQSPSPARCNGMGEGGGFLSHYQLHFRLSDASMVHRRLS